MAHDGILGNSVVCAASADSRGAHLYRKNDEELGKINELIFDHVTAAIRYVVDTGEAGCRATSK